MNHKGFANIMVLIIIGILVGVSGYIAFQNIVTGPEPERALPQKPAPIPQDPSPPPAEQPKELKPEESSESPALWNMYQDRENRFSFQYPDTFVIRNEDHPDYPQGSFFLETPKTQTVEPPAIEVIAMLPRETYPDPDTNFLGAWFAVSYDPSITTLKDCQIFEKNGIAEKLSQTQTVNGIIWYYDSISGAAAGTTIENRIYHTLYNQICYEVDLNLATTSPENVPGKSVTNETEIWKQLEDLLETFTFTQ